MLAHGLPERGGARDALSGAGGVGRSVEVHEELDEGVVVRAARRRLPLARRLASRPASLQGFGAGVGGGHCSGV